MKRIIFLFVFGIMSLISFGQETEHLKFMGIPIDGTLTEFTQKLIQKGFKKSDHEQLLTGKFAQEDAFVYLYYTPQSKKIFGCTVIFNEHTSWNSLKYDYLKFKESLIQKYGNPIKDIHYFSNPYDEGDGYEMTAIQLDKCNYACIWNNISIIILTSKNIAIYYEDPINKKLDDIEKDMLINEDI